MLVSLATFIAIVLLGDRLEPLANVAAAFAAPYHTLALESEEGRGTTVHITLPAASA